MAFEKGYKWSNIVKTVFQFSNKTDNALRRKFRNLMIKKDDDEIRRLIKNKKLEDSIIKFKSSYYNRSKKVHKNAKEEEDQAYEEVEAARDSDYSNLVDEAACMFYVNPFAVAACLAKSTYDAAQNRAAYFAAFNRWAEAMQKSKELEGEMEKAHERWCECLAKGEESIE